MRRFRQFVRAKHTRNSAGIYHLQDDLQSAVFGSCTPAFPSSSLLQLSLKHLQTNGLLNQPTMEPKHLNFKIPKLLGHNLDAHFQKIGRKVSRDYLDTALNFKPCTEKVETYKIQSGWTKYENGVSTKVDYPDESILSFDTEVMYMVHEFAVMATAVGEKAVYVWLSPWLLGDPNEEHLVPLGTTKQVVIGHNVGFDRKRVLEEYSLEQTPKWFADTMGLHIAVNGMCNQQRGTFAKYEASSDKVRRAMLKQEPWLAQTCGNSLQSTMKFHLNQDLSKGDREYFKSTNREEILEMAQQLIEYCMNDSRSTALLFNKLLPKFLNLNPHPVTIGALRHIAQVFLPIRSDWNEWVEKCERVFNEKTAFVNSQLHELANDALENGDKEDPWLSQLDWTVKPIRYTKGTEKSPSRPVKNQKMPGKPMWYKELFTKDEMNLTTRTRTATLLMRLRWEGRPLEWSEKYGWTFRVPEEDAEEHIMLGYDKTGPTADDDESLVRFKLPHPSEGRCTNPLAKFYFSYFENGVLNSENDLAKKAIRTNLECSYWLSARSRIMNQMPVKNMILPRIIPIGAVTRRAVEDTWLTASNAKKNKIGSELKANVVAPPGYAIIGADVDSEELWIAGIIADSIFKMHGGTAIGWMTLEGSKQAGTDLHSKSAQILGINRNEAKVFNYGRIYGAGKASAANNLRRFNPQLSLTDADKRAKDLYDATKGERNNSIVFPLQKYWFGGTESIMYNQLELLAGLPRQLTPVLGAGISDALVSKYLKKSSFMTTRTNWSIQSSGVDYLHLLISSMDYLCRAYNINARLLITVHDEVRYLIPHEQRYRGALALQVANLWTRALFCQQLGLNSIPDSIAFFSAVDIDTVLRKEANDPCVSITQPDPIPSGESLDIRELLEKCDSLGEENQEVRKQFEEQDYVEREPVMAKFNDSPILNEFIEAQIGSKEVGNRIEEMLAKSNPKKDTPIQFVRAKARVPKPLTYKKTN